ncbi:MAG: site-specific integrase [Clostridia bacterium]|nr:site-specific integrase [Clostridia bacterium]
MAKREAYAGTITKVKDKDLFMGRIQLGFKPDGKPNRKTVYGKTKAEVAEKIRILAVQFGAGACYDPSTMTIKEWIEFWIDNFKKLNLKPKTLEVYKQVIACHIIPNIGHVTLKTLTAMHLQRLINEKFQNGMASASVRKMHNIISSSLDQALKNDMIPKNPAKAVKLPTLSQKAIKYLTESEQKRFFEAACKDDLFPLFVLAAHTGLRLGELLALNWGDIDFKNGTISVTKNAITVEDFDNETDKRNVTKIQDSPKTRSSIRKVPLSDTATQVLKTHRQNSNNILVFSTKSGTILNQSNVRRSLHRLLEKAGINKCGFHTLRHTFATRLFEKGISAKIVSEFLGHSKVGHTLDIYTHCTESVKADAIKALDISGL